MTQVFNQQINHQITFKSCFFHAYSISFICIGIFLFLSHSTLFANNIELEVKVVDAVSGEPLIGATINNNDYSFAAITNFDGQANISNKIAYHDELTFSYVGYSSLTLPLYQIKRQNGLVQLYPNAAADTIVIIGRRDDLITEIPYQVDRIKKSEIQFSNAQTSADALASSAGIFIQKTQMGGGSPVIRGFEANRVLLVADGVRLNNAIYRNGHLQSAITIDNAMLEQVEVIYGPGSLTYGSDALGGVVHFRTKDPTLLGQNSSQQHLLSTNFYTRFASANLEKRVHFDLDYGQKKWGFITSITFTDYDALRAGNNRPAAYANFGKRPFYTNRVENTDQIYENSDANVQIALGNDSDLYRFFVTGYSQIDFLQKVKYKVSDEVYFVLNNQISSSTDIPRYDNLLDTINQASKLKFSEWHYGPQFRFLTSLKARLLNANAVYDKATIIAAFQKVDEDRISRKFSNIKQKINREDVFVYALTADFDKYFDERERHLLTYGVDISHNTVFSNAQEIDITTNRAILGESTRYPSNGSNLSAYGAYLNYRWQSQDTSLSVHGGLRYSSIISQAKYLRSDEIQWPDEFITGIKNTNQDLTWAAGITWKNDQKWEIRAAAAKAFRAPNIDDFAKIRVKGNKVTVPNIHLAPERALNYELTVAKELGNFNYATKEGISCKLSATAYYTHLTDAIVRVDSSTLNEDVLVVDGELHNIQTNINANNADIYGVSANILVNWNEFLKLKSQLNYIKGTTVFSNSVVQDTIVPFSHIPPLSGSTSLIYDQAPWKVEFAVRYNGKKAIEDYAISDVETDGTIDREGTSDNFELTPTIINSEGNHLHVGAYAWATFNIYTSFKINRKYALQFAVENITDFHYRPFSSTISAPGRNFIFSLHGTF